jgi:hypothetical protein
MATPPASFDWKQYYATVCIDPATESIDMTMTRKELESITRHVYNKGAIDALLPQDNDLIPTDYDEQKAYYARKRAGKKKSRIKGIQSPGCTSKSIQDSKRLLDAIAGKFDEHANPIPEAPDQSLTAGYISMMENEGSDGDDWNKALAILYPEKENDE